jgi:hypothetical protein
MIERVPIPKGRREPALLLIPCLLALGILAAIAPLRDAGSESNTVRAQALRAPELRPAQTPPFSGAALLATEPMLPLEIPGYLARTESAPVHVPRAGLRPTYHSRAPPASI